MTNKSQKNIKLYVNLTKSMLNEQLGAQDQEQPPPLPPEAEKAAKKAAAEKKKLRKRTANNILRYLSKDEAAAERNLMSVIKNIKDPEDFDSFQEKTNKILQVANARVQKFGQRVLNTNKLSISNGLKNLESDVEDMMNVSLDEQETNIANIAKKAIDGAEDAIQYLSDNPDQVEDFLNKRPEFAKTLKQTISNIKSTQRAPGQLQSKKASEISNGAKKLKARHLKNLEVLSKQLKATRIDPVKVFSSPVNADVFAEMRIMYTILTIFEDFDRIGKNLQGNPDEKLEYLQIITPQRMMELYKTSRREFDKIVSTLIKGAFASKAAMGADIARAKAQRVGTFSAAATGKLSEILNSYENVLLEAKTPTNTANEDWYEKLRDPNHEYRRTFDDFVKCFKLGKDNKLKMFSFLLSSSPAKVKDYLEKMEKKMSKTKGRCRPDPEDYTAFFESQSVLKEQLTIENETDSDLSEFMQVANNFYPYSKENLGFDRPVKLRLVSDMDNSKNTFGRTAYYDPNSMEIVIYTDNRHPKDMLRSFSHELVHHAQNCRGDFDREIETDEGYAQRDPYMREKEAEAYLIGNGFMVRDYEDSLKEKNKMLSEEQIREMVRAGLKKALFENEELEEGAKPDFLDLDKDGDKEEPMADAAADAKEDVDEAHCPGKRDDDEALEEEVDEAHCPGKRDDDEELEEAEEAVLEEDTTDEAQNPSLTVESRLKNKNDFLFEKLTKMWTK